MDEKVIYWVISFIFSGVIAVAVAEIVKKRVDKQFEQQEKNMQELLTLRSEHSRTQNTEDMKAIVKAEIDPIVKELNDFKDSFQTYSIEMKKSIDDISDGTLSSLRNDILTCYYRCSEKGYRNNEDFINIHDMYEAYTALHGNSFIADTIARFDLLPTKEEFEKSKRKIKRTKETE